MNPTTERVQADELKRLTRELLEVFVQVDPDQAEAALGAVIPRLRQEAQRHAGEAPAGKAACRALELLASASVRVVRLPDGPDLEIVHHGARWTLDLSLSEVSRCLDDLSVCSSLETVYEFLHQAMNRNLKYFPLGDREEERFYLWFHGQYRVWLALAENTRLLGSGGPPPHPGVQVPLALPWEAYDGAVLARFVNELVRRLLGKQASMLTVISDGGETPFVLYERVEDGVFGQMQLFKGYSLAEVRACLAAQGLPVIYTKRVCIGTLRQIWRWHVQYMKEGGKATYVANVLSLLAHEMEFTPLPAVVQGALSARRDIHGLLDCAPGALPALPNLEVQVGRDSLRVDMGAALDLRISAPLLLELSDALAHSRGLAAAYGSLSAVLARGAASRTICLSPRGFLGWLVRWLASLRLAQMPALLRTMTWSLKLLGSPLRIVLQMGTRGFLLRFDDGQLARVDSLPLCADESPAEVWRRLCQDPEIGFVHFVIGLSPRRASPRFARSGKANARRSHLRLRPHRRRRPRGQDAGSAYYPDSAIAGALLKHFQGLGLLTLCDLIAEPFV
jgi:hypothetical protein